MGLLELEWLKPAEEQRGRCGALISWNILMIVIKAWLWNCHNCTACVWVGELMTVECVIVSVMCVFACDRLYKKPWTKPERAGPASSLPIVCPPFRTQTLSPSCLEALSLRKGRMTSSWPWREHTTSWLPQERQLANCSWKQWPFS